LTFNSPVVAVDCTEWRDAVESLPVHRMTASEVAAAMERAECLRLHALKIASGGLETPNVANNRIAADREAGCCNSG